MKSLLAAEACGLNIACVVLSTCGAQHWRLQFHTTTAGSKEDAPISQELGVILVLGAHFSMR
jgi:hypothetical protein